MDRQELLSRLAKIYRERHPKSEAHYIEAQRSLVKGGSHNLRLFDPFPFIDARSEGSRVTDLDGNTYVDFWQGHFTNILGHNPRVVLGALRESFAEGQGLITGFTGALQRELAEAVLERVKADKIRFTTTGALATMYAVMLARAHTGRDLVLKVRGGWHGANPYLLKAVTSGGRRLDRIESAGLPRAMDDEILVTRFNDVEDLKERFKRHGERIACFIVEPFIGAGGFLFADPGYLAEARALTRDCGSLLIFDEVVSGFRFHAGPLHALYGIEPELTVLGKALGGGMPLSAVAGRGDILERCSPGAGEKKVMFEGGTFSAHPSALRAGSVFLRYLVEHEKEIYPRIGRLGALAREGIEEIFAGHGFNVRCTGHGSSIAVDSSIVGVHFLREETEGITRPEQVWNPSACDLEMREKIFKLAMLNEGFHIFHGFGAVSHAHTEAEIRTSLEAVDRIAKEWKRVAPGLLSRA